MSSVSTAIPPEFEFTPTQNELFASLARKMALVGFALFLFGGLQMINGIMSFISTRYPDKVMAAAKEAGMPEEKLRQLEKALTGGSWLSPATAASIAFAITGLFMMMMGAWTQQSARGFAGIVVTKGQDIALLMVALGALHKKYHMLYTILWVAAIFSLISLGVMLYQMFSK